MTETVKPPILVVDDNPGNLKLIAQGRAEIALTPTRLRFHPAI